MCFCARVRVNSILVAACTRRESRVLRFNEAAVIDDEWVGKRTRNVGRCLYSILIDFFAPDATIRLVRRISIRGNNNNKIRARVSSDRAFLFFFFSFFTLRCARTFGRVVIVEISCFEV